MPARLTPETRVIPRRLRGHCSANYYKVTKWIPPSALITRGERCCSSPSADCLSIPPIYIIIILNIGKSVSVPCILYVIICYTLVCVFIVLLLAQYCREKAGENVIRFCGVILFARTRELAQYARPRYYLVL